MRTLHSAADLSQCMPGAAVRMGDGASRAGRLMGARRGLRRVFPGGENQEGT